MIFLKISPPRNSAISNISFPGKALNNFIKPNNNRTTKKERNNMFIIVDDWVKSIKFSGKETKVWQTNIDNIKPKASAVLIFYVFIKTPFYLYFHFIDIADSFLGLVEFTKSALNSLFQIGGRK